MDWILDFDPSPRFPVHTRGNVSEVFPDPITPLNATTGFLQNFEDGYRDAFVASKVWGPDIYDGEVRFALLGLLGGYVYINMSYLRVFAVRVPGYTPELLDLSYGVDSKAFPYVEEDWHVDPERTAEVQQWLDKEVLGDVGLGDLDADRQKVLETRAARPDLTALTDTELVDRIRSFNPELRHLFRQHALVTSKTGFTLGAVMALAAQAGHSDIAFEVVGGVGEVDSTGPTVALADVAAAVRRSPAVVAAFDEGLDGLHERLQQLGSEAAEVLAALDAVRADWGFRGQGEWELRCETWETDVRLPLALVDRLRRGAVQADARGRMAASGETRDAAASKVRDSLAEADVAGWDATVAAARTWVRGRERTRTTAAMLLHEQRMTARELGRRAHEAGHLEAPLQVFQLLESELDEFVADPSAWTSLIAQREKIYLSLYDYIPPFMVTGDVPDRETWQRVSDRAQVATRDDAVLRGAAGSPGVVRGRARIISSPTEVDELDAEDILVAATTDPAWTPLFLTSAGVVTEVGGIFSHGPIVCRELGTPCVVALEDATRKIPDGALIEVDGTAGTVTVLEG
ncbi:MULTISPECIES: PEP-utilizing enzyme [unclassified Nocardioides]|uniref:PEP-utilizing enzyme n=1 Tax=unclassified Nocardioides TaxID=2615069 RepID=UPI0006F35FAA|nr:MULTISPECIES: PEP-utilizing enzyme [unclassified Nocardioides]KQY50057.1 hypothetical protein ASD30_21205 [Nocardioides sp. Root140]KQZ75681.1 hypothetical protein ASD66_04930 [Nocardioides sp. Root151]KRF14753.1 hypothetical protein ASH02_10715 [Nocardioides sp. Soil796]